MLPVYLRTLMQRNRTTSINYQIRIEGHVGPHWADWFEGMSVTSELDGSTLLSGPVADQSALHGLLKKVRDLGMPLVSVLRVEPSSDMRSSQALNPIKIIQSKE